MILGHLIPKKKECNDIFGHDKAFVPIHIVNSRFILAVILIPDRRIVFYDMLHQSCLLYTQMMVRTTFVIDSSSIWKLLRQISVTTQIIRINPDICTLFLMFLSCCVLTFHFLFLMSTAVTTVDSGISTCMLVDCLSTNTTIPTIIEKKCLTNFREKMIHSLETNRASRQGCNNWQWNLLVLYQRNVVCHYHWRVVRYRKGHNVENKNQNRLLQKH